jgi:hypothetical protein
MALSMAQRHFLFKTSIALNDHYDEKEIPSSQN